MINIECKNTEFIRNKLIAVLSDEDKKDLDGNINQLNAMISTIMDWDSYILIEIMKKANINFILHYENCEGGSGINTTDFKFSIERRFEQESDHYVELAKMYTVLSHKDDYEIYIYNFC